MNPCPVPGCRRLISPDMAFCAPHWRRVPLLLKAAVNGTWSNRRHAVGGPSYAQAVRLHEDAKRKAVAAVLKQDAAG